MTEFVESRSGHATVRETVNYLISQGYKVEALNAFLDNRKAFESFAAEKDAHWEGLGPHQQRIIVGTAALKIGRSCVGGFGG